MTAAAQRGGDGGGGSSRASTLFFGGTLLLVSLGFLGLSVYVTTSSRSSSGMLMTIGLLGGSVLGGTGLYVVYKAVTVGEKGAKR